MANAKSETQRIGDHDYECSQLTWGASTQLFGRLLKSLGPAMGTVAGASAVSKGLMGAEMGPAVKMLAKDLTADDVMYIVNKFLDQKAIKLKHDMGYKPMTMEMWDLHFTGQFFNSLKVIVFALKVNFGDFLDGVRDAVGEAPASQ